MIFPKTVAYGEAFCNREEERKRLRYSIENIQHTLVISPRRYGKTSLILKTIEEVHWPYVYIDLFLAIEETKIVDRFLDGIAKLVSSIVPINIKAISKIREFFKSFNISLTAGDVSFGFKLEAAHLGRETAIRNAIEGLESLLQKQQKRAIFFIDEMQDIVQTPICSEIEAILRFYAQKTKNLAFIFSGSNRKLLQEIFDDRSRPLFKMCDRLNLQRISENSYQKFLNDAALKKWKFEFSQECLDTIFNLTERHPYYVNYLCSYLWQLSKLPTPEKMREIWYQLCQEEKSQLAVDMDPLSPNQKRLLEYIAQKGLFFNPTAQEHQLRLRMTSRGIAQSLKGLIDRDLVEKYDQGIRITDPMLKAILLE